MKKSFLIFLSALLLTFTACFTSCDSWMSDDDFYGEIENDVKVANAAAVSVYVRYANSKMGSTEPSGFTTLKVDVPSTLTAVTNDDYGFVRWVAFSTSDFPTNQQHSNLFYENEDHYAENYLPLELPASEVFFSEPTKTSTKVTLYTTRSDIFIMPLVTKRPTVVTSVPSNGRTDVVKNSQIRILFSKPIDESTLVDEFGNSNIQITSGRAVLTESSDDLSALDITHYFDFKLSRTKKMLTISAKKGADGKAIYKFDNNAQISITLFEDLKDSDGYAMNGSYKFSFTTGTKEDSLAPKIDNLTAGIGQNCLDYQQYKYDNTDTNNKYSILAQNAPADATDRLSAYITESNRLEAANKVPLLNQRVKDKLNIFIRATDIAGAGANLTLDNNNMSENDVALVQVRACLYADKDGNPVTSTAQAFANGSLGTDTTSVLYIREYGYAMGMKDSDCQVRGAFETVTSTQTDQSGTPVPNTSGTLFTYDLSTLDDGLIKIDFWAVDLVGNSGDTEVYAGTYDNGYRSIFVVKDHTAPDAATEVTKVITESGVDSNDNIVAPYEWYNSSSLNKIKVKDLAGYTTLIHDNNNEFLRSDDKNLKWIFKVGNDPSWAPAPSDSGWTLIHNDSNVPVPRTLSNAVSSTDGRVDVTMCLMDDLGNVSVPALLNSINYDNTAPVVSPTVSWVKNTSTVANTYTYEPIVATTDKPNLTDSGHILEIPFTEEWAGLRRIKVTVQKDGTGTPVAQGSYTIRYVPSTGTARDLTYSADGSDNNLKILSGTNAQYDAAPVKTGNLYISGIKIGNENGGTYHVTVDLWDSSLNHSVTSSDISIDTTPPVIEKAYIPELKHSISISSSEIATTTADHWFLPHEYIRGPGVSSSTTAVTAGYIPLYLFVKEADSGIHRISFANTNDSVVLFNEEGKKTTLWKLDSYDATPVELPSGDYTVDPSTKTIELVNNPSVKLSSSNTNGFVILIKDIGFSTATGENKISVTVEDLATLKHIETNSPVNNYKSTLTVDLSENITASGVYTDSYLDLTPSVTLADRGSDSEHLSAVSGYTNEAVINLTVTLNSDSTSLSACSGHNKINLSGASFIDEGDNKTVVKVGNVTIPYELSADKKTITLRNKNATTGAFTNDYIVIRSTTPVQISNILLDDSSEATRSVTLKSYDLTGWESSSVTKSIIYDYQAPELYKGPYTANRNDDHKTKVYPHYKEGEEENQTGIEINDVKTFYTNTTAWTSSTAISAGLGIKAKDNVSLYGSITSRDNSFLMCYKHDAGDSASTVNKAKVIARGSLVTGTKTNGIESTWVPSGTAANEETNAMFQICFETGTYSAVIVDKAGNCSNVFHFAIKEDSTADNTDLQNRVLIQQPDTSSFIYPNNTTSVDSFNNSTMRTKKYVTKKSSSKYTLILNLGATYQAPAEKPTTKLDGTAIETVTAYSELEATATSSPIEYYSVSSKYIYYPDSEDSTTHIAAACNNNWLEFKANSEHITDSTNNITSYVDGNKNIIIELPNTQSTAPVTVFLKDACDNTWDIVFGKENDPNDSRKVFATSYIIDDHLGWAATDANGEVVTPIVMQNPYMTSGAGESEGPAWGNEGRYKWNNQSGNTDGTLTDSNATTSYGETGKVGFVRDRAKKATYYNPDINSAQSVKIGLTLRFGQAYNTRTNPESVTFEIDENQKAPAADVTAKKYTARALLYCTQSNTKPTKQDILNCYNLEFGTNGVAGVATGRITDWTYVQANNSTTTSEVTLLLDYPKPDYTKLTDWTLKNSNGEPEPYYIWYLYEDRIGNYEIAKLVNSGAVGDALKALKTDTSEMYDRWFYDADKPKITIRGETTKPEDIESNSADIENSRAGVNKLVATNNGYVPYLVQGVTTGTVYVSASQNHTIRSTNPNLKNENVGNGTTHHVEEAGDDAAESVGSKNRTWLPFFDIEISEATGVRAFCWSNSSTAPAFDNSYVQSTNNTQGDYSSTGAWYAGYTATTLNADIGCDFHYDDGSTRDATNAYFSYDDSSYAGAYSGTKVNTVIPFNLISSGSYIFLHIMDWTGNVQTVRMGKNLVYAKDITNPVIPDGTYTGVSEPNKYYISKDSNNQPPLLRIAGNGTYATSHDDIEVDLPNVSDGTGGTGILGYSLGDNPIYNYSSTDIKEKLTIPYSTYSSFGTTTENATSLTYYVYDKVGNISQGTLKCVFDVNAPSIASVALMQDSSDVGAIFCDLENGEVASTEGRTYAHPASSTFHENAADITAAELQKIYIKKANVAKFKVNLTAATDDIYNIEVRKWNGTAWGSLTSIVSNSNGWSNSDPDVKKTATSFTMSAYNVLGYETSGSIYQILATDISGNTSCQYFKLFLDNVAPTFEVEPTVTIGKGSINKDAEENVYYYTADNDHKMSVTFTLKDENGIGGETLGTNNKLYYRIGTSGSWMILKDASENLTRSVTLQFTNETVESIYVKDALGNVSSAKPLKYVYGKDQNDQDLSVSISKLQYYSTAVSTDLSYAAESGWENSYQGTGSCTILNSPKGVIIKDKNHQRVKITFTPPTGVVGYVVDSASDAAGVYSMKKSLKTTFEVVLPTDKSDLTKTFYAVDYVGKTHQFDLYLTYNNPLAAQDIVFLPADSPDIPADLATDLGITLTPTVDNGTTRYYKNGWIVVRCTLKKNDAGTAYSATPTTVKLYDTNSITNYTSALSTHTGTSLKTYSSTTSVGEGVNKRYYYYLAFQLSDSHKDKTLYCVMTDASKNTSDATALGNVAWTQDTEAPTITTEYVITESSINKLKGFVLTNSDNSVISSIGKARDSFKGNGYQSNLYPSGAKVFFKWRHSSSNQYIKDNSGTIAKYKFVVTSPETSSSENFNATASASDNDWKDLSTQTTADGVKVDPWPYASDIFGGAHCYMFELPDVTSPHCHLALFLMDKFGNVSKPYYLIHEDNNVKVQWWLTEQTLSDYTYTKSSDNKTYSIKLPLGTVINNISVNGAEIDSFKFIDYTKGDPSVSDLSNGWIVLKGSDAVGLTVTLKNLAADWSEKPVNLKINNVEKTVYTIPAKTLSAGDIRLETATATETAGVYTISATIPADAKDRITEAPVVTGNNISGVTAEWNGDKSVITLRGATPIWTGTRTIGLTIKTSDGDFDKGTVKTVDQKTIDGGGYTLGTYDPTTGKVEVSVTDDTTPVNIFKQTGHKLMVGKTSESEGTEVFGANVTYDSTEKKFTITGMPGPSWSGQQNFTIKVSTRDGDFDNGGIIHTVAQRTLQNSDVSVTDLTPTALAPETTSVTFKLATSDNTVSITSVSLVDSTIGTLTGPDADGKYTLTAGEGATITGTPQITVATNHGDVTVTKTLYAGGNSNIRGTGFTAGGITAFGGGAGSGDTTGSRITQFFNNVANVFVADSTAEKPVAQNKQTEKEAKALAKAAKKATKKAKKSKKSQAATSPVVELPQSDSINTTVTTDTMMPVIEWEQSDRIEITEVTEEAPAMSLSATSSQSAQDSDVQIIGLSPMMTEESETTQHPSTSAILVVMLAVLSSAGGAWYTLKRRKK